MSTDSEDDLTFWEKYIKNARWFYAIVLVLALIGAVGWMTSQWSGKFDNVIGIPWLFIASVLPAVLVFNHTLSVQWLPPKGDPLPSTDEDKERGSAAVVTPPTPPQPPTPVQLRRAHVLQQVKQQVKREYSGWAIGINYYLPTLALAVAGLVVALLACQTPTCCGEVDETLMEGLRYGALGAYVYVLMTLCERTFRGDISPGLAQWSAGQLILGPLLGGVLASVLLPTTNLSQFSQQVLYFVAGLAPRQIIAVFSDAATRFFANNNEVRVKALIPLSAIGGITTRVEDRLFEEGIEDAYQLSMSNPIRLTRDTPYELTQIVDWMNRALLHAALPEAAARLQQQGIRGALDLAHLAVKADGSPEAVDELVKEGGFVKTLADEAHLNVKLLVNLIQQLHRQPQVALLEALVTLDDKPATSA